MKRTQVLQRAFTVIDAAGTQRCCRRALSERVPLPSRCPVRLNAHSTLDRQHRAALTQRSFSTSRCLQKKGGKAAREEKRAAEGGSAAGPDPSDFSELEADIAQAVERLKNDLSKLRAGGRFNPEVVENLRVQPEKSNNQTVRLSDLAQVIPKGRQVQIIAGEKDHLKPISSAIQSSTLSLTPQPDPSGHNPLLLILNIPPPTAESRKAAVNEASKAGEKAGTAVRDARGKQQKKLRAIELSKAATPDRLKKAKTQMEGVVSTAQVDVKKIVDEKKKVLEQG